MPPKIKELIAELERNGFRDEGGKGSHRNFKHPSGEKLTISGKLGSDAKSYQEKLVKTYISKGCWKMKTIADQYEKIIYWSDEDECFIGICPELFGGGVHGSDPEMVFRELLDVVDEWVAIFDKDGDLLPAPKRAVLLAA